MKDQELKPIDYKEPAIFPDLAEKFDKIGAKLNLLKLLGFGDLVREVRQVIQKGKITQDMFGTPEMGGEGKYEILFRHEEAVKYMETLDRLSAKPFRFKTIAEAMDPELEDLVCGGASSDRYKRVGDMDLN